MKKILLFLMIGLGLSSCKNWLDINYNPNSPTDVSADLVFPQAQLSLFINYGGELHNYGSFFVQYFDQAPGAQQYYNLASYNVRSGWLDRSYTDLYRDGGNSAQYVIENTDEDGTYYAAVIIKAFIIQTMTDAMGDAPYAEAFNAKEFPQPKYDDGKTIYAGLLAEIAAAEAQLTANPMMTTNDLLFGGDFEKWRQFGNALKLRLYMRQVPNFENDVKAKVQALIAEDGFPNGDVMATFWTDESGKRNPWQATNMDYFSGNNHILSYAFVTSSQDDRMDGFANPAKSSGVHVGGVPVNNKSTSDAIGNYSTLMKNFSAPVYLITLAEIDFFKAEAAYRWGTKADAQAAYEEGIENAFAIWGTPGAAASYGLGGSYRWADASPGDGLKLIALQKWLSLAGVNGFEAWCEQRRFTIPSFGATAELVLASGSNYTLNTLIVPGGVSQNGTKGVGRFFYPDVSNDVNNNTPARKDINAPLFWMPQQ